MEKASMNLLFLWPLALLFLGNGFNPHLTVGSFMSHAWRPGIMCDGLADWWVPDTRCRIQDRHQEEDSGVVARILASNRV